MAKSSESTSRFRLPTDAELRILQVLWGRGSGTVREVHEALSDRDVGYTTVLKQMQIMAEKGLLARNERYRSHVYEASAPRELVQRLMTRNLLQRVFEGSARDLVLGALSSQPISSSELAEIRKTIEKFERRKA